jgi:cytochrome c peroxidase
MMNDNKLPKVSVSVRVRKFFLGSARSRLPILFGIALAVSLSVSGGILFPNPLFTFDSSGVLSTYGKVDVTNPFFRPLGSNGRTCNTCHLAGSAWSITPADVHAKFNATKGMEPIFRTNDGSNCPSADVSTPSARASAYSMLLNKAVLRISLAMPANAEFQIIDIQDPYNCAETTPSNPAFFRRPLPSTNLRFLSAVMWDGRETVFGSIPGKSLNLKQSLTNQGQDAVTGHAQGAVPSPEQLAKITEFETSISTAQVFDVHAGNLTAKGATGGPIGLSQQNTYIGINDALGGDPTGAAFNSNAFTLYESWKDSNSPYRRSVARGEALFNTLPIPITGVAGLNDSLKLPVIMGTCTTCHDTPNAGNHSLSVPLGIGTTAYPAQPALDIAGLPVYRLQCLTTGETVEVTDIGRAMISGKCADIGKVKGPVLRALAARAPYFHNGGAKTLDDAVEFYNERFSLALTSQQKSDLAAFLRTL